MFHKQKTNKISKHLILRSLATWFVRVDTAILLHYLLRLKAINIEQFLPQLTLSISIGSLLLAYS